MQVSVKDLKVIKSHTDFTSKEVKYEILLLESQSEMTVV